MLPRYDYRRLMLFAEADDQAQFGVNPH